MMRTLLISFGLAVLLLATNSTAQTGFYTWGRVPAGRVARPTSGGGTSDKGNAPYDNNIIIPQTVSNVKNLTRFGAPISQGGVGSADLVDVNITGIATGGSFSVAWSTVSNELFVWGYNENGVLCLNNTVSSTAVPIPLIVPENEVVDKVVAGKSTFAVLTQSGRVYTCGAGAHGQLGTGSRADASTFVAVQPALFNGNAETFIIDIKASQNTFLVETSTGEFFTWGSNAFGLLGIGKSPEVVPLSTTPVKIPNLSDPLGEAFLGAGPRHLYVVLPSANSVDSEIFHWGFSKPFQLLAGHTSGRGLPTYTTGPERVTRLEAAISNSSTSFGIMCSGTEHGAMTSVDGKTLFTWGSYIHGRPQRAGGYTEVTPHLRVQQELVGNGTRILDLACGDNFGLALTAKGTVYGWGSNQRLQLANQQQSLINTHDGQELYAPDSGYMTAAVAPVEIYSDHVNMPATAVSASAQFAQVVVSVVG